MGSVPPPHPLLQIAQVCDLCSRALDRAPVDLAAPRLNLDRFGMPRDFATYMWVLYKRRVADDSPVRLAFLHGPARNGLPSFGQQMAMR